MKEREGCCSFERLCEYREGELSRAECERLEAHVAGCRDCAARLGELDAMTAAVGEAALVPAVDLVEAVRWRARLPPVRRRPVARLVGAAMGGLAVAAGLAFAVGRAGAPVAVGHAADPAGFQARGAAPTPDSWVRLRLFRVDASGASRPLADGATIAARDRLLVAYDNLGPSPYGYLSVVAVDGAGAVHWYYPPAEAPGPRSIPAIAGRGVELSDEIAQPLAPGRARLFALFSRRPLDAAEIDRALHGPGRTALDRLPLDDTGQHSVTLDVRE